jgi:hypothetical protein
MDNPDAHELCPIRRQPRHLPTIRQAPRTQACPSPPTPVTSPPASTNPTPMRLSNAFTHNISPDGTGATPGSVSTHIHMPGACPQLDKPQAPDLFQTHLQSRPLPSTRQVPRPPGQATRHNPLRPGGRPGAPPRAHPSRAAQGWVARRAPRAHPSWPAQEWGAGRAPRAHSPSPGESPPASIDTRLPTARSEKGSADMCKARTRTSRITNDAS